jgi:uncharacterized ion transporter superfamily protein YfcC
VLVMFAALCVVLILPEPARDQRIEGAEEYVAEERANLGRMTRGGRNTLVVFLLAVTFLGPAGPGGLVLGTLLADTGLAEAMGKGMVDSLGVSSLLAITVLSVVIAVIISETTSNTASAAVVVPIVIPIAVAAGVSPMIPALAATFGASHGFMLAVSTPANTIVSGSGLIPITKMVRSGVVST